MYVIIFFRRVEEIEKTKAPQILKIEYDEASGVSSDDDSDDISGAEEEESVRRMESIDGCTGASDADKLFTRHIPPIRKGEYSLLINTGRKHKYNTMNVSKH